MTALPNASNAVNLRDLVSRGLTLGAAELAEILGIRTKTIQSNLSRRPNELPPSLCVGGVRRWRAVDVEQWLAERVSTVPRKTGRSLGGDASAAAKKRRGAPTKAERIAAAATKKA